MDKNGRFYIWGTGEQAYRIHELYSRELEQIGLQGYIDNDSKKWGSYFFDKQIYSPDILKQNGKKYILIVTVYSKEIIQQILKDYSNCQWEIVDDLVLKRVQILSRYEECEDQEIREVIDYLKEHRLQIFNYRFVEKYNCNQLHIEFDFDKKLYFSFLDGKRMYFARSLDTVEKVKKYYRSILLEQDINSPHRYLTEEFNVPAGATVVDAGVAEGNFSLSIIERVEKLYLFEPDKEWVEALQYTFMPYQDKVIIVQKSLSNYVNEFTTKLDEILKDQTIDFIKMDIEGEEIYALQGAEKTLQRSKKIKCVICTYHQEFAYDVIKELLKKWKFTLKNSRGYMWFPDCDSRAPVLRRGLLRGEKI